MIAYKEIAQIKNVKGVNPITGDYSYEENGRGYLCIDGVLLEKEETASKIISVGEYVYVWYNRYGIIEIYSGHTLLKTFQREVYFFDRNVGPYIRYQVRDPKTFEASENILSISDGQPLLAQNVPYRLYKVGEEIIGYKILECKLSRLNYSGEVLWTFDLPLRPRSGEPDNLDKVLGLTHGMLWICTRLSRLIALDLETGKPIHQFSSAASDKANPAYTYVRGFAYFFFREADKAIITISNWGIHILNATTAEFIESYEFSEVDSSGREAFEYLDAARLYGDCLTFIAQRHREADGYRCAGIFDLKARRFSWIGDIISLEEKMSTGNQLLAQFPLQMAGNRLYIKDEESTLHIYRKEWRLKAQVRPQSEATASAVCVTTPSVGR
ncbi:hypothetical protein HMPREF1121_00585 [Porphyromonas sp. KLE 1280]|uniref:PQQ enzyme repeat protein n=1 Tax=Porphyromonas sp. KLE 1280 TaxID=997829 RepID=UPI0004D3B4E0|nr:PQQ enzyme repeat protein [Porphyromonas sp. KLE 1280]KDU79840.1 hypothetical protein HMPREF1121_00585 [Porphyromonas sp. KLE 1280]